MKKSIWLVLILIFAFTFVGCGENGDTPTPDPTPVDPTPQEEDKKVETIQKIASRQGFLGSISPIYSTLKTGFQKAQSALNKNESLFIKLFLGLILSISMIEFLPSILNSTVR